MLAQLHACHLAPNTFLIGNSGHRVRNCAHHRQQATSSVCSRSSTTAAAAAAEPPRRGWRTDYVSGLGALLSNNQLPQAVELLESCLDSQHRVHGVATGELLEALCAAGHHSTAWHLLRRITAAKGRLPLQVLHRLLKAAGQFGTVSDVLAVYNQQQQAYGFASAGVQTTLIHALLKAHSKSQPGHLLAYEAWGRLKGSGKQLDAQALLAGVHACVCVGQFRQADALLEPLKAAAGAAGRPMVSAYNIILKGHVAADNIDTARRTFSAMTSRGLAPDAVTYNTLLSGFVRCGDLVRARSLLRTMQVEGVQQDAYTYTSLALGYGRQGQLQEMLNVVQQMQEAGIRPNSATYTAVIDAHASSGQMQQAEQLLQQLLDNTAQISILPGNGSSRGSKDSMGFCPAPVMDSAAQQPSQGMAAAASQAGTQAQALAADGLGSSFPVAAPGQLTNPNKVETFSSSSSSSSSSSGGGGGSTTSRPVGQERQQQQQMPKPPPLPQRQQQQQKVQQQSPWQQPRRLAKADSSQQDVAGGTRNRQQVLRQQYNSLIKGWLQLAADEALEQAEQQWLLQESSLEISNSSSSFSTNGNGIVGSSTSSSSSGGGGRSVQPSMAGAPGRAAAAAAEGTGMLLRPQVAAMSAAVAPATVAGGVQQAAAIVVGSQQQQQQPGVQRVGVGLLRPVLPPQPPAGGVVPPTGSSAAAGAGRGLQTEQPQAAAAAEADPKQLGAAVRAAPAVAAGGRQVDQAAVAQTANRAAASPFAAALEVFQRMQAAGVAPAADTYTLFIDFCIKVGNAAKLQEMLDAAVAAGVRPDQVMLTSLIKAAWKADAHGAAGDVFNALLRISGTGSRRGSSSSSSSSSAASSSSGSPAASMDGSGSNGSSGSSSYAGAGNETRAQLQGLAASTAAAIGSTPSGRQQQQRVDLSQTLRAYARAAVADALQPQASRPAAVESGTASGAPFAPAGAGAPQPTEQQRQQADMQRQLEQQLQQQMAQARQQPQQQGPGADSWSSEQQQQQQQRRPDGQLLLPLSAPIGPDSAAWNSLVAALVKAGQLDDAAAALERSTQASAAAGASRPPVEGYSALIRGYRRAGMKQKAVVALRQFLSLGGRPGRVMCDDVITLCLDGKDIKTARQVVRAMELTGSLDADSSSFYQGWFRRWEQQQQQQSMSRTQREAASSTGGGAALSDLSRGRDGVDVPEQRQLRPDGSVSGTVAVERLKWWLGLPNSYYRYRGEGRGMCANEPYAEDDARQ